MKRLVDANDKRDARELVLAERAGSRLEFVDSGARHAPQQFACTFHGEPPLVNDGEETVDCGLTQAFPHLETTEVRHDLKLIPRCGVSWERGHKRLCLRSVIIVSY